MKKIFLILPILMLCSCNRNYVVDETAVCRGLSEDSSEPVFCVDKSGKPINGRVRQYYPNGKIWREMTIRNGVENGVEREYYENGKLHVVANVVNSRADGKSKLYNEKGKLYMEIDWANNQMVGFRMYDDNGKKIQELKNTK